MGIVEEQINDAMESVSITSGTDVNDSVTAA